jgi:hypothetical protein
MSQQIPSEPLFLWLSTNSVSIFFVIDIKKTKFDQLFYTYNMFLEHLNIQASVLTKKDLGALNSPQVFFC